ncbi:Heme chaperone HemW [Myxococcaceae bacterium]|nr:Heme chaperone HemW [Myxococcaceae bacterium]
MERGFRQAGGEYHPDVDDVSVGIYLHIPFCERICPYCDFAVVRARPLARPLEERYVRALETELDRRTDATGVRTLETIYLGGGTPSLLAPESIARLVEACRSRFAPAPDVEVTLETNPGTVDREKLPGFAAAGVNRLSVGIQSFDDTVLRRLGRAHRAIEGRRTLDAARAAGFANVSVDLIVAAPGQDEASLESDLDALLRFAPEHVSTYALTIEPGTPFALAGSRGQLALADEESAVSMLVRVAERLDGAGIVRYEISNFATPGFASRHNRRYWERRPVLGLGVGAVSCEPATRDAPHGARRQNLRGLEAYLERIESGASAEASSREVLEPATARGEAVFLALRTSAGLRAASFSAEFGAAPRAFFGDAIERLVRGGFLEESPAGDLRLTPPGILVSDSIFADFV